MNTVRMFGRSRALTLFRHHGAKFYCNSYIVKSQYPKLSIPDMTLDEFVWKNMDKWPDRTAVVCGITGRNYTYSQVHKLRGRLAQALRGRMGLKMGDTVAIVMPNVPEFFIAFLGSIQAGLTVTTVNPIYTKDEISRQLIDSGAKIVFTLSEMWGNVNAATKSMPSSMPIITIKNQMGEPTPSGAINFTELCEYEGCEPLGRASMEDLAILPYSSGTTGLPKGVCLTHRNLVTNLCQMQYKSIRLNYENTVDHQDVIPVILPMYHLYALVIIFLNMFSLGCKLVILPRYQPNTFLDILKRFRPNVLHAVPPLILFLSQHNAATTEHLSRVRVILCAAAPLAAKDTERFLKKYKYGVKVLQGYGLTETSPLTHIQRMDREPTIGGSGWNIPHTECRIIPLEGPTRNLGPNETGEILIRGPQIMQGYLNQPQATKDSIDENGWFRTGDIGYYNEDEQFFITDRLKELIKVKGLQVAPAELEAILRDHPEVDDAAVTSIAHPTQGEVPKAFLVIKANSRLKSEGVHEYMSTRVAKFKQLTGGVVFVDNIPKNPSGKILRRLLKTM